MSRPASVCVKRPREGGRDRPRDHSPLRSRHSGRASADRTRALSTERKLQVTVDVEIVDQTTGRTIWTRKGMLAEGTYAERAEADGRREALTKVVNDIIAGAQSQW